MSISFSEPLSIITNSISTEDFYNHLYWDHRIYDLRSTDDYIQGHICRAHHMNPSPMITIESIADIDKQIDEDYGRADNPSKVLIYCNNEIHYDYKLQLEIFNLLLSYLTSFRNPSNKLLKQIYFLTDGYEDFHSTFPFLCSDSIHFNECNQLIWPSFIMPNLYLGSAICRNETIITMLKITHIMSFSDYREKKLLSNNVETVHWQVSDSLSTNLLPMYPVAVQWISKAINIDKGTVLVHCDQGVSRSASIILAYLLYSNPNFLTVDAALSYVKLKRDVIRPNASFLQQLEEYLLDIKTKK